MAFLAIVAAGAIPQAALAACSAPVCFVPGPQATTFAGGDKRTSSAVYDPISIYNISGGNYDVAFTLPLLPVYLNYPADTNGGPVNFQSRLATSYGDYVGTGAGKWSYAPAANPLPNGALTITAYQVHTGKDYVGIASTGNARGFAVKVNNPAGMPVGNYHWVQVVADNYNITTNPGPGKMENVLDNGGIDDKVNQHVTTPYYDTLGVADQTAFYDSPSRNNQDDLNQNDWWIADLFLATGPGATGANNVGPGAVTIYNTGIQWGWGDIHISLGPLQNLRALFAQDTSSITNFDLAFGCSDSDPCTALNQDISQGFLTQLDEDFDSAIPEPSAWSLTLAGAAIAGGALRRRRASTALG